MSVSVLLFSDHSLAHSVSLSFYSAPILYALLCPYPEIRKFLKQEFNYPGNSLGGGLELIEYRSIRVLEPYNGLILIIFGANYTHLSGK